MNGPIVVDVGNTRIKWGRCDSDEVREIAALAPDDESAWDNQWRAWDIDPKQAWIVASVHPQRRDKLVAWLHKRGANIHVLTSYRKVPIVVGVETPEKVGIDRLLNGVAANRRRPPDASAVLIDAGSAVTVDFVDASGAFRGGAIFPGLRLMAQALHAYTAALPIVTVDDAVAPPGASTVQAIRAGVFYAVLGGIERLIAEYQRQCITPLEVYLTGGDAQRLSAKMFPAARNWPTMTLEGILHSMPR